MAPCIRCTQCNLLNRQKRTTCNAFNTAQCGHCLPGFYELRSMRGQVDPSCVPCNKLAIHTSCLRLKHQDSKAQGNKTQSRTVSMVLVGSATAASTFQIILIHPAATHPPQLHTQLRAPLLPPLLPPTPPSELMPSSRDNEVPPASIVINVTINIKPSGQYENALCGETGPDSRYSTQQMEQHLQTIWDTAQGQSIDLLYYDAIQDMSLLLGSADHRGSALRRFARFLGVPPQILAHLHSAPNFFHYLRASTYILLPQLAQAAALLPCPGVVARIHQAVMNK
ncbi:LOW QUALITY PROTEIN: tumor necrosis factor receptor superfamily member 27-like [Gadus chalcogrammus]|uniref:LOW QUALITY PROTEIN: tumor necrosis factor receptor superfamily member 27-like n=1 Tax=Gadus chalcogrammus TaxID=1042646 RepID=UPI0024C4A550|nr:LOW QUALITY PROTEIN: tumor necrosis factor receptor superfamily member 27-like [Gadus chalcogrammus]